MSEKIIDSLKDWFESEWLFERHLTSEFMRDKEAFKIGCENYDVKNYSFKGDLNALLRKESGLAEVARTNKNLEKYATHCFRQVELILSEFNFVNPGREKIGKYLLNGNDIILSPTEITNLNPSVSNLLSHTYQNTLNKYCLILKVNYIKLIRNKCFQAPDANQIDDALKSRDNKYWQLTQSQQEKIFKAILYFETFGKDYNLSKEVDKNENKPSLYAFSHMYHFRNLGSHLNSQEKYLNLPKEIDAQERRRLSIYYTNALEVMNIENESPGFYQRYVDVVLFLYSEYLKNPKF